MFHLRKYILLFWLILAMQAAFAQQPISITNSDMPNVNDTFRYSISDNVLGIIDLNQTGADQQWDYSTLGSYNQRLDTLVDPIFGTPLIYNVTFTNFFDMDHFATLAARNIFGQFGQGFITVENVFDFFKETGSYFANVGLGLTINGIPLTAVMEPRDMVWEFPLEYGDEDNSFAKFGVDVPQFGYFGQKIWRTNTVDAWGQLSTRYGTFNTIRVTTIIDITDTLSYQGFGFEQPRQTAFEIKWLAKNVRSPLLTIKGQVAFGQMLVSGVEYLDSVRGFTQAEFPPDPVDTTSTDTTTAGIHNIAPLQFVRVSPNPVQGKLRIDLYLGQDMELKATIFSITGAEVAKLESRRFGAGRHVWETDFDMNSISPGMYSLVLTDESGRKTVRKILRPN